MYSLEHFGEGKNILLPKWAALTTWERGMLSTASELGEGHPGFTRESKTWRRYHSKATKVTANGDLRGNSHDYGKGARPSLTPGARCWLGTLP